MNAALEAKGFIADRGARLRLASDFSIDPIGVLRFTHGARGGGKHGGGSD